MPNLPFSYRAAVPDDASAMAELVNMAGEGLPFYLWSKMAEPGQTVMDVGISRAIREVGGFSYRNTVVREADGRVASALIGYSLDEDPEAIEYAELPPMFVPLQRLEDRVPGTWYVNVLATYPDYRGKGYGRELLSIAESLAHEAGSKGMSIIVADTNQMARRLYENFGFEEQYQLPMVKEDWQHPGKNWVLLLKEF